MTTAAVVVPQLPLIDEALLRALRARGFDAHAVPTRAEAKQTVLGLLPDGALVAHGGSTTLEQIGVIDALAASGRVRYGNAEWLAEDDAARRLEIRKHNVIFADVFLGGVQAIARTGQVVGCDAMGTRQGPYVWGPGTRHLGRRRQQDRRRVRRGMRRVYQIAFPLEDVRVREAGDAPGSGVNKLVIYEREPIAGRTTLILIPEALGF